VLRFPIERESLIRHHERTASSADAMRSAPTRGEAGKRHAAIPRGASGLRDPHTQRHARRISAPDICRPSASLHSPRHRQSTSRERFPGARSGGNRRRRSLTDAVGSVV